MLSRVRQHLHGHYARKTFGFTIVELLIVIVVLGILVAIVIVAYTGITSNAKFTSVQGQLQSINKALASHHAVNGSYPVTGTTASPGWRYSCEVGIDNFIPGLDSKIKTLPQAPCQNPSNRSDTWIYTSDGTGYKLLHIRPDATIANHVPANLRDTRYSSSNPTWGYWSSDWASQ